MLNYHKINGQTYKTTIGTFNHYLSLGSHKSSYPISDSLVAFSVISLINKGKFIVSLQNLPRNSVNFVIPIKGKLRIDQKVVGDNEITSSVKYIEQFGDQQQQSIFIYLVIKNSKPIPQKKHFNISDSTQQLISGIKISKKQLPTGSTIQNNSPQKLVFVQSGLLTNSQTEEQFNSSDLIYFNGENIQFTAVQESFIILLTI